MVEPLRRLKALFDRAARSGVALHDACALATADARGRPSVRFVLAKRVDARGVVFYTNARSRKGRELRANPRAALAFFWDPLNAQVRVEGRVRDVPAAEADEYWDTRPRESNLGAAVSDQSAPIRSRGQLLGRLKRLRDALKGRDVPRPRYWTGFRIVPDRVEFWSRGAHRLHHREEFTRLRGRWRRKLLQP